jgi:hypothetical protein
MVQAIAQILGEAGLARDARQLMFEPRSERHDERLALLLARATTLLGAHAADRLLDRVERGDPLQRLAGDRRFALGVIEEPTSQVRPAEGERDPAAGCLGGDCLVGGVAVALDDAPIIVEQLQAMDRSAAGRIGVGDRRRVRSAPRPIVAGDRPEIAALDPTAARIEHRRLRLVDRDLGRGQDEFAKAVVDRPELRGRVADPERQRRALDVEPLSSQHLGLTIERQMPGVFGHQHGGHHRFGRQAALDQPLGRRRLNHRLLAGAACVLRAARHQHPELRRNHVQTLRDVGPDRMHRRAAARAGPVLGLDRDVNARKMGRQHAAVRPALLGPSNSGFLVPPVVRRFAGRDRLLDILQRQSELVRIELLGLAPELHSLELAKKMRETIVLPEHRVALDDRGVPLGQRRGQLRLQRIDVGRGLIRGGAHA